MAMIEKLLKTYGKEGKRYIYFGKKESFEDGEVVVIHKEDFSKYKEEYDKYKNENGDLINKEALIPLQNQINQLEEEKAILEEKVESQQKEIDDLSSKLEYAQSSSMLEEIKSTNDKRVSDLKEAIAKKEKEVQDNMDTIDSLRQQKENELNSLRKEKDDEIETLRNEKENEMSIIREKMEKVEKERGNLETTFGMLLRDYRNLSDKTLVRLFYRKNDDIKQYEDYLNSKSLQTKDTYALPMEKKE